MKEFILKSLLFAICITIVILAINVFLPLGWGKIRLAHKTEYFLEHRNEYNTIVVGSSLVHNHIKPTVFDELTTENTSTFNLGLGSMYFFESYYFLENLLKKDIDINNVIFLIQFPRPIADINMGTIETNYFLDFKRYQLARNYFTDVNDLNKLWKSFLYNKLQIGSLFERISFPFRLKNYYLENDDLSLNLGYDNLMNSNTEYKRNQDRVRQLDEWWEKLEINLQSQITTNRTTFLRKVINVDLYMEYIAEINKMCNEHKVRCTFLLMPNYDFQEEFKNYSYIYMGNSKSFPEFYSSEFRADRGHLNDKGAELFSRRLAKSYNEQN